MGISPEQSANWPKSRKIADAICLSHVVIWESDSGLGAAWADNEEQADAWAVGYQQQGYRAWYTEVEGDGWLVPSE